MNRPEKLSVVRLTWPIFIEQMLFMMMGTADTFMLSRVSGDAVAAVGASNQVVGIALLVFNMVSAGTAVFITQYLGANRSEECGEYTAASITVNFAFGLVVSALVVGTQGWIVKLMQLPSSLLPYTHAYLSIVGATLFIQSMLGAVSSVLRSNGYTRQTMYVSFGMNILHICGNYMFIFGAFGVPKLDVTGVAMSTVFSRFIALVVMFLLMYRMIPYQVPWRKYVFVRAAHVRDILKIGIPSAGEPLAYQISQLLMTSFMAVLGATVLATRVYTLNIMFYILLFSSSVGTGTQILVGHLVGAGKLEEAYQQVMRSLRTSFLATIVIVLCIALSGHMLFRMFTSDPSVIHVGSELLFICILLEPGRTFNLVIIQSLRAAGDVRFPVMMGILFMLVLGVPLAYLFGVQFGWGLVGLWLTFCFDEWSRGIIMFIRWRRRAWEQNVLIKPVSTEHATLDV